MKKLSLGLSALCLGLLILTTGAFASSKPKVVYVFQEHCGMCHKFEEAVLSDSAVKKELERFEFKKVLANEANLDVEVTPTVFIYDKNGKQVKKFVPSADKNKFIQTLKKAQ